MTAATLHQSLMSKCTFCIFVRRQGPWEENVTFYERRTRTGWSGLSHLTRWHSGTHKKTRNVWNEAGKRCQKWRYFFTTHEIALVQKFSVIFDSCITKTLWNVSLHFCMLSFNHQSINQLSVYMCLYNTSSPVGSAVEECVVCEQTASIQPRLDCRSRINPLSHSNEHRDGSCRLIIFCYYL